MGNGNVGEKMDDEKRSVGYVEYPNGHSRLK